MKYTHYLLIFTFISLTSIAFGQDTKDEVVMDEFGTVDLVVNETEVTQVLEMLAIQSRKNIIASNNVTGAVSANLYNVTFSEALDAVLRVNGFGYIEEDNFVYVYTIEELDTIEKARRKTESRIFELQYLSAADADEFVKPLLSDEGKAAFRGDVKAGYKPSLTDGGSDSYAWASKLVINDYPENLKVIAILLADLDTAPTQVVVECTVVQTKVTEDNEFGVDFTALSNIAIGQVALGPLAAAESVIGGFPGVSGQRTEVVTSGVGKTELPIAGDLKQELSGTMSVLF